MILDIPVQQVIDEFHDKFHARQMFEDEYLESKGVKFDFGKRNQQIQHPAIYLLTVPSLNIVGGAHSVIYHVYPSGCGGFFHDLHDPVMGRENKKYYVTHFKDEQSELAVKLSFYTINLVIWPDAI